MSETNKKQDSLQDIPQQLSRAITFLQRQRKIYMGERLKEYGFVGAMYMILLHIHWHPGTTQDGIASHMYIDKCTVTRRTQKLEELGYLRRETGKTDRRQNNLYLTESGEALVPVIRAHLKDWATATTKNLNDDEKQLLVSLLDRMIHTDVE